jgi:multiple sugar transport system permease protein
MNLHYRKRVVTYMARSAKSAASKNRMLPYWFILPALLLIGVFLVYPVGNLFYYSFRNYNMAMPFLDGFAGMDNFVKIFTKDRIFYSTLLISAKWVITEVVFQLVIGLALALLLNQNFKLRGLFRAITFSPWAISGVLTSMMWALMYNQNIGIINDLFVKWHWIAEPVAWLANIQLVFKSVVVAELWRGLPFFAILLLAALQTIPEELYEACRVDGGGCWKRFWYITLPYLKNTIVLSTLLRAVWEFNQVDLIYTLTGGGPARMTTTLSMYIVDQAINANNFGYGSALTVVAFMILLVFAAIYLIISKFGKEEF